MNDQVDGKNKNIDKTEKTGHDDNERENNMEVYLG